MSKIIKFQRKKKTAQEIADEISVHIDNFTYDVAELLNNEGYGEILEEKLSGMVVVLDFIDNEVSAEIWVDEEDLENKED